MTEALTVLTDDLLCMAFDQGRAAWQKGGYLSDNPYQWESWRWHTWRLGFHYHQDGKQ